MPAHGRPQGDFKVLRQVEALTNVIETVEFGHEMMDVISTGLDQRQAVVARVDMEEKGLERLDHPIAEPKAQQIAIEGQQGIDMRHGKHGVAQTQGTGAESRDGAAWLEGLDRKSVV